MRSLSLLIKPASGNCNMRCQYCFYKDEMENRTVKSYGIMSDDTLECILGKFFSFIDCESTIMFQGGEPTLAGLPFFKNAMELAEQYNVNHIKINYGLQTNGYHLDTAWAEFLSEYHFLVGISLDGYQEIHDLYRKDAEGNGTWERVMKSIEMLQMYQVDFNILTVVTEQTVQKVNHIYNFFRRNDFRYQQYIECLDPLDGEGQAGEYTLSAERYGDFLIALFKKWHRDMMQGHYISIRYFDNIMMMLAGREPESCNMRGCCTRQWVIEADGSVYPCDFYALDDLKLGNFVTEEIEEIEQNAMGRNFVTASKTVPEDCKACEWFRLCRNGCRRNCGSVMETRKKNHFCSAYRRFFSFSVPGFLEIMRR